MPAEAQDAKDARHRNPTDPMHAGKRPISLARQVLSPVGALVVALLAPLGIFAPRWFAQRFAAQQAAVPLLLVVVLALTWLQIWQQTSRFMAAMLLLGALGLVGLWAVATILTVSLVARWEEPQRSASYKAGSLVFSFAGGFCLLLLLLYWFGTDAVKELIVPRLRGNMLMMSGAYLGLLLIGLVLSVIAPIQFFRGMTSLGGGVVPALDPLCRDCGYSLEGVAESYYASRRSGGTTGVAPGVCSECGCELAASLDEGIRPGTSWTRGEWTSPASWLRTLWAILRQPGEFFAVLPLDSARSAAVRFCSYNLLAALAIVTGLFAVNHWLYMRWELGMPVPITTYESASLSTTATMSLWLPATLIGATMVMYAIVMAAALILCASAEVVWQHVSMLRGRNMHPAGLFIICYLSGHVLAILVTATAAFLLGRLAVRAIPPEQGLIPWLTYEHIMAIRTYGGGIGVGTGVAVFAAGAWLWYRRALTQAVRKTQYANR